jgi:hypothetical protein
MNGLNAVTREVIGIEGENPADTVDVHRRHELCIVYLDSQNIMLDHQALPFRIDSGRVRQDRQELLDFLQFNQSKGHREPRPLLAMDRVATFQNSDMFCSVKYTGSGVASSFATLSTANVWLG